MKLRVFVSYSGSDKCFKDEAKRALAGSQHLEPIVVEDVDRLGCLFAEKVADALWRAHYLLLILTPEALKSEWVNQEIGFAQALGLQKFFLRSVTAKKTKGFVHSEMDLGTKFSPRTFSKLLSQRVTEMDKRASAPPLGDIFPGVWLNRWAPKPRQSRSTEAFELRDEHYVIVDGRSFQIKDAHVDAAAGTCVFSKVDPTGLDCLRKNEITLDGTWTYAGKENGDKIEYRRLARL